MEKLVFFDLETGGLKLGRPIIQIAAIAVDHNLNEIESIEMKIRFNESDCTKRTLKKNGYDPLIWRAHGLPRKKAAKQFADFLRRHATIKMINKNNQEYSVAQLVAHNASFDGPFLHTWYQEMGKFCPARFQVLCTMQRSLWYAFEKTGAMPNNYQLKTLCDFIGISFDQNEAHDVLYDVRATVKLYKHLLHTTLTKNSNSIDNSTPRPTKHVIARITPKKVPAHQAFR